MNVGTYRYYYGFADLLKYVEQSKLKKKFYNKSLKINGKDLPQELINTIANQIYVFKSNHVDWQQHIRSQLGISVKREKSCLRWQ